MQNLKLIIVVLIFFNVVQAQAQTNFLKGYYINLEGDTVRGYIDYRSETRNFSVCGFKANLTAKPIKLFPDDILGFVISDTDFFERHSFKGRKNETLYGFFNVIMRGKLSLLRFEDRYFVKNDKNEVLEITKTQTSSNGTIKADFYGLGILKVLMQDCAETNSAFLEAQYNSTPNYTYIFQKYNRCVNSPFIKTKKLKIKPHVDFGLQASLTATNLNFSSTLGLASMDTDFSGGGGVYASVFIPKVNDNLRLMIEATYGRYNQYDYFTDENQSNDLFVKYSMIKLPVFFRISSNKLFFDFGVQNQFILNQDITWRVETTIQNTIFTQNGEVVPLNSASMGILAGAGVQYDLFDRVARTSLRYSQTKSSKHPNQPVYQTLEFIFSLQLKKINQ
jgi:hypothetical protein